MSIAAAVAARAAGFVMPAWVPWAAGALVVLTLIGSSYGLGRVHEARIGAAALANHEGNVAIETVRIVKGETEVVIKTEIEYRDRIRNIYIQGEQIEKDITEYIQPADDARFGVNVGFLRNIDAAWAGIPVGPAADTDREPAGVPLSEVAEVETGNATSCRVWREQALGWRVYYARQQVKINGTAGEWASAPLPDLFPQ